MLSGINRGIRFSIYGKFAHFRKFYTNSSSLSYLVPPRTVLSGVIASVLKIPRDQYYETLGEEKVGLSVGIPAGKIPRRQMQSMNYLHSTYFNVMSRGSVKEKALHSQCKLELLSGQGGAMVEYDVLVVYHSTHEPLSVFEKKIMHQDHGYGIYLGQRQFRGHIRNVKTYSGKEIELIDQSPFLDSVCRQENILKLDLSDGLDVCKERMPSGFSSTTGGRESAGTKQIVFEKNGCRLSGLFSCCCKVDDSYFSFY